MQGDVVAQFVVVLFGAFLRPQGGNVYRQCLEVGMALASPVLGDLVFPGGLSLPELLRSDPVDGGADVSDDKSGTGRR